MLLELLHNKAAAVQLAAARALWRLTSSELNRLNVLQLGGLKLFLALLGALALLGGAALADQVFAPAYRHRPESLQAVALAILLPALPLLGLIKALDRNDQVPWLNLLCCLLWAARWAAASRSCSTRRGTRSCAASCLERRRWGGRRP